MRRSKKDGTLECPPIVVPTVRPAGDGGGIMEVIVKAKQKAKDDLKAAIKPVPKVGLPGKGKKTWRRCCDSARGEKSAHLPECPTLKPVGAGTKNLSSETTHGTDA